MARFRLPEASVHVAAASFSSLNQTKGWRTASLELRSNETKIKSAQVLCNSSLKVREG